MNLTQCRLGDVMTLQRGHDLPNADRADGDIPVVSSSGITGWHNVAKANGPGVVTGRYGTIGQVFYLEQDYWPLNTALYVVDFKGNDPKYVSYLLKRVLRDYQSDKAAVPGVNRNVLHEIEVLHADKKTQLRIVEMLSAYDDLIANNRRRIALLEEAARQIYKEWFVRLRFPAFAGASAGRPGYEKVKVVKGVPAGRRADRHAGLPEGWERKTLGEVLQFHYGKSLKEEDRADGEHPVFGSSGVVGHHSEALVDGPGIIVGRKGNVGSIFWSSTAYWPIDTVYYVKPQDASRYVFHLLQGLSFQSGHGAVPGLNRETALATGVTIAPESLRSEFECAVKPLFEQVENLTRTNERLAEARDLLMARLMRGKNQV